MIQNIFNKLTLIVILAFSLNVSAQYFNYTISIADTDGSYLTNTAINLQISLLEGSIYADPTYVEEYSTTTNNFGIANIQVGTGYTVSGAYSQIDWSNDIYIKSEYSTNGNELITINTAEVSSVPLSLYSEVANSLIITSDDGSKWKITADNDGNLVSSLVDSEVTEYGTVDYIFDEDALPTITLEITTDEWNELLFNYDADPNNEDCIEADFTFNKNGAKHKIESIGLRLRGNTSRVRPEGSYGESHNSTNPDWHHCHFAFRFEKYLDDNLFSGTDRFSLRWAHEDPTYVHEVYSYDLLRRFGVYTTFKSSYCRLEIKIKEDDTTAYYGIYEMFEGSDDQYFEDRVAEGYFKGDGGYLWKMGWGSGVGSYLTADHADGSYMGYEDIGDFSYDYKSSKSKFEDAKAQFMEFIANLNSKTGTEFEEWAEENINIDLLLRAKAVTVAVGQWDGYWGNGNNFYLYFDEDGMCYFIPYDCDNALGTTSSGVMSNPGTQDPLNWGVTGDRPLITKVLAVDRWKEQFKEYLLELASADNDYLDADMSKARIEKWHNQIGDYVDNDTNEDCVIEDKPASWSSNQKYRVLSGDDNGTIYGADANFFSTRVKAINEYCQ